MNDAFGSAPEWPYLQTLVRLALAIGLGLFVGLERERRGKEAGVRTFAFVAAFACIGGFLGDNYALAALGLLLPFIVFLNIHALKKEADTEMTTSAALVVMAFVGILCGKGHTFTPVALGLATAGLLAWKQPLAGFSIGITENELRSAILLGILAFVVYPVLPANAIDPWGLIEPRTVWITVILIAAIGFGNYILLKLYGSRGIEAAGFLAGLVNSTVAVTELSQRAKSDGALVSAAFRGTILATAAMLIRNALLLALLAPKALYVAGLPMALMLVACIAISSTPWSKSSTSLEPPTFKLDSPFSLRQAIRFGAVFLALSVLGSLAERGLGSAGFYAVSAAGGLVSSASAVASAGQLAAGGHLSYVAGGIGAVIASIASAAINVPLVARIGQTRVLSFRVGVGTAIVLAVGIVGALCAPTFANWIQHS
jgi:uncharacterized membrane protein (DUF4010 family)